MSDSANEWRKETDLITDEGYTLIDVLAKQPYDDSAFYAGPSSHDNEYTAGGSGLEATNVMILDLAA